MTLPESPEQKSTPKPPEIEIAKNTLEIQKYLAWFEANGIGKPIYTKKKVENDNKPDPFDTLARLEHLAKPPSLQTRKQLVAIALPLTLEEKTSWLIITTDGHFIKVIPPENDLSFKAFSTKFADLPSIEMDEESYSLFDKTKTLLFRLSACQIPYNTAINHLDEALEAQIENDLEQAFKNAVEIKNKRMKDQLSQQQMLLERLKEFFNPPAQEEES